MLPIKDIEKEQCIFKFSKQVQFQMIQDRDMYCIENNNDNLLNPLKIPQNLLNSYPFEIPSTSTFTTFKIPYFL